MYSRLSQFVSQHWLLFIFGWLVVVGSVQWAAPRWDDVTYDGDLAFLPPDLPSVRGEKLEKEAFPNTRAKSQIVLIVARDDRPLDKADLQVADVLASRFHNRLGAIELARGRKHWALAETEQREGRMSAAETARKQARAVWEAALAAFDEANRLDETFAATLHNRALIYEHLGRSSDAARDREIAWGLEPSLRSKASEIYPPDATALPLVDVWNRFHEVFGPKLRSTDRKAQLTVLQLSNEFMATDNIRVLQLVERELDAIRGQLAEKIPRGLEIEITGSAAVGGDMLRAAAESIRHTEILTVVLVITILLLVYRSPLLVVVPLATIGVSLLLSTGILAMLTQLNQLPGFEWWGFKIFKTSKIFIVVILFGSGTDFCLFLIARLREELRTTDQVQVAMATALPKVANAIVASALTTILGLATMFFADFGKFRNSGPAIGLCLLVTLAACLTFAPAILSALGRLVFWPFNVEAKVGPQQRSENLWGIVGDRVVRRPALILLACALLLSPFAICGWSAPQRVSFDFLSELPPDRSAIRGTKLLERHLPVGEGGPVIVLARRPGARFEDEDKQAEAEAIAEVFKLTQILTEISGVHSVRSIAAPLGERPEGISLTPTGIRKLAQREHPLTKSIYLAQVPPYRGQLTRFEVILNDNPFSINAIRTLARIDARLRAESSWPDSFWHGAEFVYTGTTAGIRDLRTVTQSDYWRITTLVTLAVFTVILILLRRPVVCVYLILSVLFSYLVTIGVTELFFQWLYGSTFVGLDWKVPIFLFVILVAVGEDYNIYLVTRVYEEQRRLGPFAGLREAMARTGGIITSCGIIMAGSFVSMVAGSLRGIAEIGFALTLGILLDTLVVRPILVPAFLAMILRFKPHVPASKRESTGI